MREGQIVYYAFVNGYGAPAVEGTLEAVEVALGLRQPPAAPAPVAPSKAAPELRKYIVHVRKKYPAWDEKDGFDHEVSATGKADAIKQARRDMDRDCMFTSSEGPVYFKARLADE